MVGMSTRGGREPVRSTVSPLLRATSTVWARPTQVDAKGKAVQSKCSRRQALNNDNLHVQADLG